MITLFILREFKVGKIKDNLHNFEFPTLDFFVIHYPIFWVYILGNRRGVGQKLVSIREISNAFFMPTTFGCTDRHIYIWTSVSKCSGCFTVCFTKIYLLLQPNCALFRNPKFLQDEMTKVNGSKIVMEHEKKTQHNFFLFFHFMLNFIFFHEINVSFCIPKHSKDMANFEAF